MYRFLRPIVSLLAFFPIAATASEENKADYVVISPKVGWNWQDSSSTTTWGVSYSRYPDYNLGYGVAVNQMFGAPEVDLTGKVIFLSLGLSAGPMVCRKGVGLTASAFSSLIYLGEELRANWVDDELQYSFTIFLPLWWRNGKFWDVKGAVHHIWDGTYSGYPSDVRPPQPAGKDSLN